MEPQINPDKNKKSNHDIPSCPRRGGA